MKLWPENPSNAEAVFVVVTIPIRIVLWMAILMWKERAR